MVWKALDQDGHVVATVEDNNPAAPETIVAWHRAGFRVVHETPQQQEPDGGQQQRQSQNKLVVKVKAAKEGLANLLVGIARGADNTEELKREVEEARERGGVLIRIDPRNFLSEKLMEAAVDAENAAGAHKVFDPGSALGAAMKASLELESVEEAIKHNMYTPAASLKAVGLAFLAGLASAPESLVLAPLEAKETAKAIFSGEVLRELARPLGLAYLAGQTLGLSVLGLGRLGAPLKFDVYEMIPEKTTVDIAFEQGGKVFIKRSVLGEARRIGTSTATFRPAGAEAVQVGSAKLVQILTPRGTFIRMASKTGEEPDILMASTTRLVSSGLRKPEVEAVDLFFIKNRELAIDLFKKLRWLREARESAGQPPRVIAPPKRAGGAVVARVSGGSETIPAVEEVLKPVSKPREVVVLEKPTPQLLPPINVLGSLQEEGGQQVKNAGRGLLEQVLQPRLARLEKLPIDVAGNVGVLQPLPTKNKTSSRGSSEAGMLERVIFDPTPHPVIRGEVVARSVAQKPKPLPRLVPLEDGGRPRPLQPLPDAALKPLKQRGKPPITPITPVAAATGSGSNARSAEKVFTSKTPALKRLERVLSPDASPPPNIKWRLRGKKTRVRARPIKSKRRGQTMLINIFKQLEFGAPNLARLLGFSNKKGGRGRR